jgi:hypothetical protein
VRRLLLVAFFLEVGLVLVLVPWSAYWDRNYFAESVPVVQELVKNNFVRGAVTGVGVINLFAALAEVVALFAGRRIERTVVRIGRSSAIED